MSNDLEYGAVPTIDLVAGLIQQEMRLSDGIVSVYNEKRRLPAAKGFFIDVAWVGSAPFAVRRGYKNDPASADLVETQSANETEIVQVDIFSYDASAYLSKVGIIFALTSTRAQQVAEANGLKIARIPTSFVDVSEVEASKRLNRYAITITVQRAFGRSAAAPTFSRFSIPPAIIVNP